MSRTLLTTLLTASLLTAPAAVAQQPVAPPPAQDAAAAEADEARRRKIEDVIRAQTQAQLEAVKADQRKLFEIQAAEREQLRAQQQRLLAERKLIGARLAQPPAPRVTKKETVAYVGVSVSEPPPVVAEQLKLRPGTGLVVDLVVEKGPAEAAGLKQYDVLTKLDDQLLTNSDQFRTLIRMRKPSDDVKLSVVRRGEPTTVAVELGQQEVEEVADAAPAGGPRPPQPFPLQIGFAPDGQLNVLAATKFADAPTPGGGGGGGMALTNVNGRVQGVWSDDRHTLTTEIRDGKAVRLTAKDRDGMPLFDGPVETDAQRKALPPELAAKLAKAEAGGPLRFGLRTDRNAARTRVLTSSAKDTLLLARFEAGKAVYAFAFSETDGKTTFDGPVATPEQRKALPEAIATQIDTLEKNQGAATEFGAVERQ
jgi:hypothetical protein